MNQKMRKILFPVLTGGNGGILSVGREKEKSIAQRITSERMRAWESRGGGPPGRALLAGAWGQCHQRGVGQRPTREALADRAE